LQVIEQHAGRRRIVAEGTAAQMESAFGVTLNRYRSPERSVPVRPPRKEGEGRSFGDHVEISAHEYRGYEGPLHLPVHLVGLVEAVIGLDNRRLGMPGGTRTGDPPGAVQLPPTTIAVIYIFRPTARRDRRLAFSKMRLTGRRICRATSICFWGSAGAQSHRHFAVGVHQQSGERGHQWRL
jgi:hypothetical protein